MPIHVIPIDHQPLRIARRIRLRSYAEQGQYRIPPGGGHVPGLPQDPPPQRTVRQRQIDPVAQRQLARGNVRQEHIPRPQFRPPPVGESGRGRQGSRPVTVRQRVERHDSGIPERDDQPRMLLRRYAGNEREHKKYKDFDTHLFFG